MRNVGAILVIVTLGLPLVDAQPPTRGKTVLDGVYSDAQAVRGKASYAAVCGRCHGDALEGVSAPALASTHFVERWREDTLDLTYNFIRQNMPPTFEANAGPKAYDSSYLDILAYILKINGYRAGASELTPDLLGAVMFVGMNGPQPVPDGSLVVTAGCLSQDQDGVWILRSAIEPERTREETTSSPAELKSSSQKRLGNLTFRLADLAAVPDFAPDAHKGHRMQAKGYLVRQPNAERILLSSMVMLGSTCGP
jgi:S-disulfanyl-L-cysteine oxidoreductase SoxD